MRVTLVRWWVLLTVTCLIGAAPTSQPTRFQPVSDPALPNAHRVTPKVICGAQPNGEAGFAALARLGVKTIISVDGVTPNVEAAHRFGMRYVHLPFGYDGVPDNQGEAIAKAIEELPGPIYVHCHHGQHRAPAAAAVACVMNGSLPPDQAESVLETFGTGSNYPGLWDSARKARRVQDSALASLNVHFVEIAPLPPLADAMVTVDERCDRLKELQKSNWDAPASHPDLDPPHEALQLRELLHEIGRSANVKQKPDDFRHKLDDAEASVTSLQQILTAKDLAPQAANAAMTRVTESCASCHRVYRNRPSK